jgi:hypothetical protein
VLGVGLVVVGGVVVVVVVGVEAAVVLTAVGDVGLSPQPIR